MPIIAQPRSTLHSSVISVVALHQPHTYHAWYAWRRTFLSGRTGYGTRITIQSALVDSGCRLIFVFTLYIHLPLYGLYQLLPEDSILPALAPTFSALSDPCNLQYPGFNRHRTEPRLLAWTLVHGPAQAPGAVSVVRLIRPVCTIWNHHRNGQSRGCTAGVSVSDTVFPYCLHVSVRSTQKQQCVSSLGPK